MALRFNDLGSQSFWNDEGNSARLSERSLALIIEGTASDIHPPLYYIILRGWRELLGESEFGLRSFSAFAGILTVSATFALGRLIYSPRNEPRRTRLVLLGAAFLAAVNPALIYYSQETRMYSLLALLAAISTIFLWRWLNSERGFIWACAYILTTTSGLYTHYFFPVILIVQNLIVLIWLLRTFGTLMSTPFELRKKRSLRKTVAYWLGMMALIFLLYLPWLPIFWRQAGGRSGLRTPLPRFLWESVRWLSFGETISAGAVTLPILACIGLLIWAWASGRRRNIIPLIGSAVPVLFMFAAGTTQPAFYKFMLTAVPFYVLWLGGSLNMPRHWNRRKWLLAVPLLLFIPLLWTTAVSLNNLYQNPAYARADYRAMADRIASDDSHDVGIILNAPNQWEVFTYYHQEGAPVYPLPKGQPDPAVLIPELSAIAGKHERLYAIYWGEDQRDPQSVVESWLEVNTYKAAEEWIGDVRFVTYAVPDEAAQTMESQVGLHFGDQITLDGYSLAANRLSPGEIVQLTLFWQTTEALDQRYKVFLHLLDKEGHLVAQHDSEPGGGLAPTTSWIAEESISDNHGLLLPADLAQGEYTLLLGLYDSVDPAERLTVKVDGELQDALIIGSISVE